MNPAIARSLLSVACAAAVGCGRAPTAPDASGEMQVDVPSMHCSSCVGTIRSALDKTPGMVSCRFDLEKRAVMVKTRNGDADRGAVEKAIREAGFEVAPAPAK